MKQEFTTGVATPVPTTTITAYIRYSGVDKNTAYDFQIGLDTGFIKRTCTPSAGFTQTSITEMTSDERKRVNYGIIFDTTARLIQEDPNNLVDGVNGTGWILIKKKDGTAVACGEIKATD